VTTSGVSLDRSTDHGLAQSSLRLSETHLRLVVEQMGAILGAVATEMWFSFSHGAGLAKSGLNADVVVGISLYDSLKMEDAWNAPAATVQRAFPGESVQYELVLPDAIYELLVDALRDVT
jgi:hypothetical protein